MDRIPPKTATRSSPVVQRIAGSPPALGKVEKMIGARQSAPDVSMGQRRRRSSGSGRSSRSATKRSRNVLRLWIITILGIAGAGLCGMMLFTLTGNKPKDVPILPQSARERELAAIPTLASEHALHLTKTLLKAENPEDIRGIIRKGAIDADQAVDILKAMRKDMGKPTPPTWIGSANAYAAPIELLYCRFGIVRHYIIPLTPDETGRWQIDFDAMVRHCEPSFEVLTAGDLDRGLVRAVVKESDYFNGPFDQEQEWRCFMISSTSPDIPHLYGYFKRGSEVELVMEQIITRYRGQMTDAGIDAPINSPSGLTQQPRNAIQPDMRLTLRLKRPAAAQKNQFRIEEIVSDEWVIGKTTVQNLLRDGNSGRGQRN